MREALALVWLSCASLVAQAAVCRLDGRVRDPMQRPVVGAVLLAERDGVVLARTSSDGDGNYRFGRLPQERLRIVVTSHEPAIGAVWLDLLGTSERWCDLTTLPARAVAGVVTRSDGTPVAGAFVVAFATANGRLGPCATTTTSDAQGRYRLGHVPFGTAALRVHALDAAPFDAALDGIADVVQDVVLEPVDETPFTFAVPAELAAMAAPLAVRGWRDDEYVPLPPWFRTARVVDGTLSLPDVAHGDLLEVCADPGIAVEPRRHLAIGGRSRREFAFEPMAGDAGVLHLKFAGIDPPRPVHALLQEVDDEGMVVRRAITVPLGGEVKVPTLVVPERTFAIRLLDASLCATGDEVPGWYKATHTIAAVHTVVVQAAQTLRLRVIDDRERPCPGASVTYRGVGRGQFQFQHVLAGTGCTNGQGHEALFGVQQVPRHWIEIEHERGFFTQVLHRELEETNDLGTLMLEPGGEVLVRSVDANGKPVPGARLLLHRLEASWRVLCTDRNGMALCTGLHPTHYAVQPLPDGEVSAWSQVRLRADERLELVAEVR